MFNLYYIIYQSCSCFISCGKYIIYLTCMQQLKHNCQPELLRITLRFALVVIIAVCRCCYAMIEQPRSSLMKFVPQFETIASALSPHVNWSFVNLSDAQIVSILCLWLSYETPINFTSNNSPFVLYWFLSPLMVLSWMATWGHKMAKPSTIFGNACDSQKLSLIFFNRTYWALEQTSQERTHYIKQ